MDVGLSFNLNENDQLKLVAMYHTYGFLVSIETVVLLWERSKQKFGFIKRVDEG